MDLPFPHFPFDLAVGVLLGIVSALIGRLSRDWF
jgi:hypothetical protein